MHSIAQHEKQERAVQIRLARMVQHAPAKDFAKVAEALEKEK